MKEVGDTFPEIELVRRPASVKAERLMVHKHAPAGVGERNKLGGTPDWIQNEQWPQCCGKRMTFYAQLDSVGDEIHLGDGTHQYASGGSGADTMYSGASADCQVLV